VTAYLLHQLLETSAARRPDAPAVQDGERILSYADLDGRANQLAHLLLELGVDRGDRVGLYLDKSLESIVGLFAVLKTGAGYVPLDPQAPVARLGYIAGDCDIRCLLSGSEKAASWQALVDAGAPLQTIVVLNAGDPGEAPDGVAVHASSAVDHHPRVAPVVGGIDLDLAYILYTSGSTGEPKGVVLTHLNAMTFVRWAHERFSVGPDDRLSSHAPLHFDLSVFDVFVAAASGALVVLVPARTSVFPREVAHFIDANAITVWYSVPSVLTMLTLRGGLEAGSLPSLRALLFAGEVFPTKYLRRLMELLPHASFHNLYGPTETNVCTHFEVPSLPDDQVEPIPIGAAIADVEVFAVAEEGRIARAGEVGELHVRGTTVMSGYWGDSERTRAALVADPTGSGRGDLVYRTGDLVQEDDDGQYRFLGRRDAQIKARGYRIELGEIETALYANPQVLECAVVAIPDEVHTNKIKAYVSGGGEVDQAALVATCAERLPRYMIPEIFEFRDVLPKTSTGKIDRQALAGATELQGVAT
jgi:amino acid adenylation domain-containing protein